MTVVTRNEEIRPLQALSKVLDLQQLTPTFGF
jgi:hypothetical protein